MYLILLLFLLFFKSLYLFYTLLSAFFFSIYVLLKIVSAACSLPSLKTHCPQVFLFLCIFFHPASHPFFNTFLVYISSTANPSFFYSFQSSLAYFLPLSTCVYFTDTWLPSSLAVSVFDLTTQRLLSYCLMSMENPSKADV